MVTGSKSWTFLPTVDDVLSLYTREAFAVGERLTVIHGDCGQGGDELTKRWVTRKNRSGWPVDQQRFPADWAAPCADRCRRHRRGRRRDGREFCPAAGMYRNEHMAHALLAELPQHPGGGFCEALIRDGSPGATHAANYARSQNIPTERTTWLQRHRTRTALASLASLPTPTPQERLFP